MTRSDLEYIRTLTDLIAGSQMHIQELRAKAFPGAIRYDDSGASKPMPRNKLEDIMCLIDQEERRTDRLIDKRHALKAQAVKEIQHAGLAIAARHILYLRYLSRQPRTGFALEWSEGRKLVEKYHNIQRRRIYQLHHDAAARLERYHI